MKKASITINRPIRVLINSTRKDWAQIKCNKTGVILHTGRIGYIRNVAKKRYNHTVNA